MKKSAAIFLAAFYLLLTTGLYVCFISCGTGHLVDYVSSVKSEHKEASQHCHDSEKGCKGDKDCSCCKKHGQYSVKENERPAADSNYLQVPFFTVILPNLPIFLESNTNKAFTLLPRIKAPPPPGISTPIFIKILSLLI